MARHAGAGAGRRQKPFTPGGGLKSWCNRFCDKFLRDALQRVFATPRTNGKDRFGNGKMQVLIAHRFALVGQALIGLLAGRKPTHSFTPVQGMAELEQALRAAPADLLLVDLGLDGLGGADGLRPLREAHPRLRLMVLAETDDPSMILACLAAGAHGYVLQSSTTTLLLHALEMVESGGVFVPAALAAPARAAQGAAPANLTERQREVLRLLSGGRPTKAIARELGVAVGTVKVHLAAIYRALGATNRVEALVKAGGLPPLPAMRGALMRAALPGGLARGV
jgi:DNA-binding NarL/FixJ family response regulator